MVSPESWCPRNPGRRREWWWRADGPARATQWNGRREARRDLGACAQFPAEPGTVKKTRTNRFRCGTRTLPESLRNPVTYGVPGIPQTSE